MRRTPLAKKGKSSTSKLQKKCDALLSPIITKLHPLCLLCSGKTQVAHHHVHKSKSLILRYDFDNLVPLCHGCHFMLHQNESYWASKITQKRGMKWFEALERKKNQLIRADLLWYQQNFERLTTLNENNADN